MPRVLIKAPFREVLVRENVERDLYWYDTEAKEMMKFRGGELQFEYRFDEKVGRSRLLPKVADAQIMVRRRDRDARRLRRWIDDYAQFDDGSVEIEFENASGVVINISDEGLDEFLDEASRSGMSCEVL